MKYRLLIVALLVCFVASAQPLPYHTWINQQYRWPGGIFNNELKIPGYSGFPYAKPLTHSPMNGDIAYDSVNHRYYFKSGGVFRRLIDSSYVAAGTWLTAGNAGTNPASQFLGTTDAQALAVRTNNSERLRVLSTGNVGINTTTPAYTLDVAGSLGVTTVPFSAVTKDTCMYWNPSTRQVERRLCGGGGASSSSVFYNVIDYGVVQSSGTNNTDSIQFVIDLAHTNGGGTVYFPGFNGTYSVDSLVVYGDVRMLGDNKHATMLRSLSAGPMFKSTGNSGLDLNTNGGFTVENMFLNGAGIGTIGIDIDNNAYFKIDNFRIDSFDIAIRGKGLLVGDISNGEIGWCTTGMQLDQLVPGIPSNLITMTQVQFHYCTDWGIEQLNGSSLNLYGVDFSACGTNGDPNTGGIYMKTNSGPGLIWIGGWCEVNFGTIVYIDVPHPFAPEASYSLYDIQFQSNPDVEQAIYYVATGSGQGNLALYNCKLENAMVPVGIDGTGIFGHIRLEGGTIVETNNMSAYTYEPITRISTAIGSTPTAAGMTILAADSRNTLLQLQPANGTHGGVVTNTTQSFAGLKTMLSAFTSTVSTSTPFVYGGDAAGMGLILQASSTSSGGSGAIVARTGNSGANTVWTASPGGNFGVGGATVPSFLFQVNASSGASETAIESSGNMHFGRDGANQYTNSIFTITRDDPAGNVGSTVMLLDTRANATGIGSRIMLGGTFTSGIPTPGVIMQAYKENGTDANYDFAATFSTRVTGQATPTEKMRITSAGRVGIANTSPAQLLHLGTPGTTAGIFAISGSTSGTITFQPQAGAGTYNWNWPTTAGSAGQYLTSQGGGSTAMTWSTPPTQTEGTWSPTVNGTANVSSASASTFTYSRNGDQVYFYGEITIDPTTTATLTTLTFTLHTSVAFSNTYNLSGHISDELGTVGRIRADVAGGIAEIRFTPTDVTSRVFSVTGSFTYVAP